MGKRRPWRRDSVQLAGLTGRHVDVCLPGEQLRGPHGQPAHTGDGTTMSSELSDTDRPANPIALPRNYPGSRFVGLAPARDATGYSITSSARPSSDSGMVCPSALTVLRLMRNLLRCGPAGSSNGALTLASGTGVVKRRGSLRQRVQDVDGPAHIQPFPEPAGARRPRVDVKTDRVVTRAERRDGITGHGSRRRHLGQRAAIRPPKLERPVGPA